MSKKNLIFIFTGIGIAILAIILRWNSLNIPLIRDEGEYAYSAWLLLHGVSPYINSFLQKPPLIIYSYALPQLLGFVAPWAFRFLSYLFVIVTTFLLGLIVKKEYGIRAGIYAMLLFTPMVLLPNIEQFTANTEMFLLLPLIIILSIYVYKRESFLWWHILLVGFFAGISILYKPTIIPILVFLFMVWLIEIYKKNKKINELIKVLMMLILGVVISLILFLGYFWSQDHLTSLFNILKFDSYYAMVSGGGLTATFSIFLNFLKNWWYLWVLLGCFIYFKPRRWCFYLGLFIFAWISSFGSWYGHYYILIMPFWAIICAISLDLLLKLINSKYNVSFKKLDFISLIIFFIFMILPLGSSLFLSPSDFALQKFSTNPFTEAIDVASDIKILTKENEKVLVAGSEPEILYYAKRQSVSRFVIFYPLMIPTPMAKDYQTEAISEIKGNPPSLIVLVNSPYSWLINKDSPTIILDYLDTLIKSDYRLVKTVYNKSDSSISYLIYKKN